MKKSSGSNRNLRSTIEKERTKMRERQRRSITTNIFHGLRQHGGYRLSPRADINEVLRHLAQEAGWVVEPDGTTYRSTTTTVSSGSPACTSCGGGRKSATPKARTIAGDSALNSLLSAGVPSLLSTNNDRLMAVYMSGAGPENACVSDAVCSAAYGKEQQFYLLNEANGPHENMLAGSPSRCT